MEQNHCLHGLSNAPHLSRRPLFLGKRPLPFFKSVPPRHFGLGKNRDRSALVERFNRCVLCWLNGNRATGVGIPRDPSHTRDGYFKRNPEACKICTVSRIFNKFKINFTTIFWLCLRPNKILLDSYIQICTLRRPQLRRSQLVEVVTDKLIRGLVLCCS